MRWRSINSAAPEVDPVGDRLEARPAEELSGFVSFDCRVLQPGPNSRDVVDARERPVDDVTLVSKPPGRSVEIAERVLGGPSLVVGDVDVTEQSQGSAGAKHTRRLRPADAGVYPVERHCREDGVEARVRQLQLFEACDVNLHLGRSPARDRRQVRARLDHLDVETARDQGSRQPAGAAADLQDVSNRSVPERLVDQPLRVSGPGTIVELGHAVEGESALHRDILRQAAVRRGGEDSDASACSTERKAPATGP